MTLEEAIENADWMAHEASRGPLAEEYQQRADWLHELVQVREENEKLRELVRRMWSCYGYKEQGCATCYYYGYGHGECEPMWDACKWESQMLDLGVIKLSDLGIEVE